MPPVLRSTYKLCCQRIVTGCIKGQTTIGSGLQQDLSAAVLKGIPQNVALCRQSCRVQYLVGGSQERLTT